MTLRPRLLRCDICAIPSIAEDGRRTKVLRFTLTRRVFQDDGKPTTRGAGGINLCGKCWAQTARPRQGQGRRCA